MALKFKSKDEIPAELAGLYVVEREGAWVLDVDGAVEKSKLDEFRNTNVSLIKERDDLKNRYEGNMPAFFKTVYPLCSFVAPSAWFVRTSVLFSAR
jgi:hypothetical protein